MLFHLNLGESAVRNVGERTATACREPSIPTFLRERSADQSSRVAASASSASWFTTWKNFGVCPTNSPSLVNEAMVATAPPNLSLLGRVTEQWGKSALMNSHGTGKIRLGWKSGPLVKKLGNVRPWSERAPQGVGLHCRQNRPTPESERSRLPQYPVC